MRLISSLNNVTINYVFRKNIQKKIVVLNAHIFNMYTYNTILIFRYFFLCEKIIFSLTLVRLGL